MLLTLIDAFESEHYRFDAADPVDAIENAMEERGLTREDLEPLIGSRVQVGEVLERKRDPSVDMIRRLHEQLGISADVLIRPTRRAASRRAG